MFTKRKVEEFSAKKKIPLCSDQEGSNVLTLRPSTLFSYKLLYLEVSKAKKIDFLGLIVREKGKGKLRE